MPFLSNELNGLKFGSFFAIFQIIFGFKFALCHIPCYKTVLASLLTLAYNWTLKAIVIAKVL